MVNRLDALTGGILTGGQARRLQSLAGDGDAVDKGLLELHGQPLVAYSAQKLQPYTTLPLLISANRNQNKYKKYGEVVADPDFLEGYQGPLAGVLAMLQVLRTDWLMVLPVDSPFLPAELILELWQAQLKQPTKPVFYVQHERSYPLCLLVHKRCAPALQAYLLAGQRRVQSWLTEQQAEPVNLRHYPVSLFFNINEPADLKQARQQPFAKIPNA